MEGTVHADAGFMLFPRSRYVAEEAEETSEEELSETRVVMDVANGGRKKKREQKPLTRSLAGKTIRNAPTAPRYWSNEKKLPGIPRPRNTFLRSEPFLL